MLAFGLPASLARRMIRGRLPHSAQLRATARYVLRGPVTLVSARECDRDRRTSGGTSRCRSVLSATRQRGSARAVKRGARSARENAARRAARAYGALRTLSSWRAGGPGVRSRQRAQRRVEQARRSGRPVARRRQGRRRRGSPRSVTRPARCVLPLPGAARPTPPRLRLAGAPSVAQSPDRRYPRQERASRPRLPAGVPAAHVWLGNSS